MTYDRQQKDLIVLVPDADMEYAIRALLGRQQALGIRPVMFDIQRHPQRDAGCRSDCHNFLRLWLACYRYALVLFDHEGCGYEQIPRVDLEADVEERLHAKGWEERCAAIVICPELESWVWSDSPVVDQVLGWRGRIPALRDWLRSNTIFWHADSPKPTRPKEAFESALCEVGTQKSASLFEELGKSVSVHRCNDPSFVKFRDVLRKWFGV